MEFTTPYDRLGPLPPQFMGAVFSSRKSVNTPIVSPLVAAWDGVPWRVAPIIKVAIRWFIFLAMIWCLLIECVAFSDRSTRLEGSCFP